MAEGLTIDDTPIWLINLPASTDRAKKMKSQLDALSLSYRRFDAVNGRADWDALLPSINVAAFERNVGRPVLQGEIGCYHSHLRVWDAFLETKADVALILEDDVVFHQDFRAAINAALDHRAEWDLLKLNHIRAKLPIRRLQVCDWQARAYLGPFTGTGAYLINRQTALRLRDSLLPITRPIDHELDRSHIHRLRHYGLTPFPSHVADAGESTITGTNHAAVKKFPRLQRLPNFALRLRNFFGKLFYFGLRKDAAKTPAIGTAS